MHIENEFMVSLQIWMQHGKQRRSKETWQENICTLYLYSFPNSGPKWTICTNAIHFSTFAGKVYTQPTLRHTKRQPSSYLPTGTMALFNIGKLRSDMGKHRPFNQPFPKHAAVESLTSHNWLCYDKHCTIVHWFWAFNSVPICLFVGAHNLLQSYLCLCVFAHKRLQKIKNTISGHFFVLYNSKNL